MGNKVTTTMTTRAIPRVAVCPSRVTAGGLGTGGRGLGLGVTMNPHVRWLDGRQVLRPG
jgi:hypothetical protein